MIDLGVERPHRFFRCSSNQVMSFLIRKRAYHSFCSQLPYRDTNESDFFKRDKTYI